MSHSSIVLDSKIGVVEPWETEENGAAAHVLDRRIRMLKRGIEGAFIELGRALWEFKRAEHWRTLGHPSFESYLADPEVNLGRRTAYRCLQVYRDYVLTLGCDTVALINAGVSKLCLMASRINPDNADEMLALAASVSRSDLREMLGKEPVTADPGPPRVDPITTETGYREAVMELEQNRLPLPQRKQLHAVIETWEAATGTGRGVDERGAVTVCPECGCEFST